MYFACENGLIIDLASTSFETIFIYLKIFFYKISFKINQIENFKNFY